eukprot:GHVQ01021194.1.p1 GENE.GHVQ01021194.1~~GHVQ01021194.1.p1  ORF type:complete len:698 (+),score=165.05 GHVQ01021194.1:84-2096(+)
MPSPPSSPHPLSPSSPIPNSIISPPLPRPSFFELYASDCLATAIRSAIRRIIRTCLLSSSNLHTRHTSSSEDICYAAVMGLVELHSLLAKSGTVSENFYGLIRSPFVTRWRGPPLIKETLTRGVSEGEGEKVHQEEDGNLSWSMVGGDMGVCRGMMSLVLSLAVPYMTIYLHRGWHNHLQQFTMQQQFPANLLSLFDPLLPSHQTLTDDETNSSLTPPVWLHPHLPILYPTSVQSSPHILPPDTTRPPPPPPSTTHGSLLLMSRLSNYTRHTLSALLLLLKSRFAITRRLCLLILSRLYHSRWSHGAPLALALADTSNTILHFLYVADPVRFPHWSWQMLLLGLVPAKALPEQHTQLPQQQLQPQQQQQSQQQQQQQSQNCGVDEDHARSGVDMRYDMEIGNVGYGGYYGRSLVSVLRTVLRRLAFPLSAIIRAIKFVYNFTHRTTQRGGGGFGSLGGGPVLSSSSSTHGGYRPPTAGLSMSRLVRKLVYGTYKGCVSSLETAVLFIVYAVRFMEWWTSTQHRLQPHQAAAQMQLHPPPPTPPRKSVGGGRRVYRQGGRIVPQERRIRRDGGRWRALGSDGTAVEEEEEEMMQIGEDEQTGMGGGVIRLPQDPRVCSLCSQPRVNPACVGSGYVFCYRCITVYVKEHWSCPVTGVNVPDTSCIRRLLEEA